MVMLEPIRVLSETTANWLTGRGYACSAPAGRPRSDNYHNPLQVRPWDKGEANDDRKPQTGSTFFRGTHIFV